MAHLSRQALPLRNVEYIYKCLSNLCLNIFNKGTQELCVYFLFLPSHIMMIFDGNVFLSIPLKFLCKTSYGLLLWQDSQLELGWKYYIHPSHP